MPRDEFSKQTSEMLAKRVAYRCSNPECKAPTIGPHSDKIKALPLGIAAHITAAAPGGPRFDPTMDELDRKGIDNGIHLCTICASLIDKDVDRFPVLLLRSWKKEAEDEALDNLGKPSFQNQPASIPFLEPDLVWESGGRWHRGNSHKNVEKAQAQGGHLTIHEVIVHWELIWRYKLAIYNNSGKMAKNIRIEQISAGEGIQIPTLSRVNNLPPYEHLDLAGKYTEWIEGTGAEADVLIKQKISESLDGLQIKISFQDEFGKSYQTITTISKGELNTVVEKQEVN